jgi:hypothetical protein
MNPNSHLKSDAKHCAVTTYMTIPHLKIVWCVVNGSKQHSDTYTDNTSPLAGHMMLRLFLAMTAFRLRDMAQLDLTNAYLPAPIQDVVHINISQGFPGAGEVAILKKAAYGTKQGARRFYDYNTKVLKHIGLTMCPNEPCLFHFLPGSSVYFLLQYVDDALIAGDKLAIITLQKEMTAYFQCKFAKPKDFLGLDLNHPASGELTLSMTTFTTKMKDVLGFQDTLYGEVAPTKR